MNNPSDTKISAILSVIAIAFIASCGNQEAEMSKSKHVSQVNDWHQERIESLKEEDSWLSLAGLHRLDNGSHTFGSDSSNHIVFPSKAAPDIGTIRRHEDSFFIEVNSGVNVTHDSVLVSEMELQTSLSGEPTVLHHKSLFWYIIERRGDYFIRLKDSEHPNFDSFVGIDRFTVSQKWRVEATFNAFSEPRTIAIPDILGDVYQDSLYGMLEFSIDGQQYSIAPLGHPQNADDFFIIFGDETNGESTYGGGRYIHIPLPDEDGKTFLDFNKAYNPPCVFTEFATCPLPPEPNRLPIRITAGEKVFQ